MIIRRTVVQGMSLLELLAALSIIGVLAMLLIPRLQNSGHDCKIEACRVYGHTIEIQAHLWKRQSGSWPSSDLGDIGESEAHFPDGLPLCPVDGSNYQIDSNGRIVGHRH